jgi:hypothetical protein
MPAGHEYYVVWLNRASLLPEGPRCPVRVEGHDCREKVRPGTGRETGLGHAGGRAPTVGALGGAGAVAEDVGM